MSIHTSSTYHLWWLLTFDPTHTGSPWLVFRKKDLYLVITQKLIFMKFGGFHEIRIKRHSLPTALHNTEEFLLSYLIHKVFRRISCEIRRISKDQLPGIVTPMFLVSMILEMVTRCNSKDRSGHNDIIFVCLALVSVHIVLGVKTLWLAICIREK